MTTLTRKLLLAITPLVSIASLSACSTYEEAPQTAAAAAPVEYVPSATLERVDGDGPAMWKVSDEDTTIYMFGTIHILPREIEWSNPTIEQALAASDTFVTEIPMGAGESPQEQQMMMARGMLDNGQTLRSLMTDEQRAIYEAGAEKLGLPVAAFDPMKPWLAAVTFSILPLMKEGYNPESGVEEVLDAMAGEDKARDALETLEYQLGVFDNMPVESQLKFLIETAEQIDEIKPMLDAMVAEWVEGDADQLAVLMNEGLTDPVLAERLLYVRNRNWAEWIDTRLDTPGTVFMAVGAGHLAGEKSVQDYLVKMDIAAEM